MWVNINNVVVGEKNFLRGDVVSFNFLSVRKFIAETNCVKRNWQVLILEVTIA